MRKKLLRAALLLDAITLVLSSSFILFSGHVAERPWIQKTVGNLYLIAATITIFVVSSFTWLKPSSWWGKMARILFAVLFGGWTVTLIIAFLLPEGGHPSGGGLAIIGMGA